MSGLALTSDVPGDYPAPLVRYYVLTVLVVVYIFSFVDRMIITMLVDPIRATLHLTDFEISLIYGAAFSLCYTLVGVPAGWLADRYNRSRLIIGGIFVWSLATAACGLVGNFAGMFAARIGVGVGESTLTPAAHSILSDHFPPRERARALSIYTSALYMGAGIGTFGAGMLISLVSPMRFPFLADRQPWQVIMVGLGLFGIPMALLMASVRELRSRRTPAGAASSPSAPFGTVLRHIWSLRGAYLLLTFGLAILGILTQGIKAWIPSFLMRTYGWSAAQVGFSFGLILFIAGAGGVVGGGLVAEWLRGKGHSDANVRIGFLSALLITPFGVAAPLMPSGGLSLCLFTIVIFLAGMPFGAAVAAIMALSPVWMRAQASALFLLGVNLIGIAGGPMVVAALTDFVFKDDHLIRYSLATLILITALPSAAIVWLSMKSYRAAVARQEY